MSDEPKLLKIPDTMRTVEDVLAVAARLDLGNVLVISERENGDIVYLTSSNSTCSEINWLLDRMKNVLVGDSWQPKKN